MAKKSASISMVSELVSFAMSDRASSRVTSISRAVASTAAQPVLLFELDSSVGCAAGEVPDETSSPPLDCPRLAGARLLLEVVDLIILRFANCSKLLINDIATNANLELVQRSQTISRSNRSQKIFSPIDLRKLAVLSISEN